MTNTATILYIEDNPDNQRLVRRVLEARGYTMLQAEDGPSGLAMARSTQLDMILIDINIPTLDGYETTTRLRSIEHLRNVPIVALTADGRTGTRERSLAAGCDGFIAKPIDVRRLPEQIQEFIGGKREELPSNVEAAELRAYTHKLVERLEQKVREVERANIELQELDRLKSQFLAMLSHELRTPLTSILGYVELFDRGMLGTLSAEQQHAMTIMARNSQLLSRQLNSLLYLQESRSTQLRRIPLDLRVLVERVLQDMQPRAAARGVSLQPTLHPVITFMGDAMALDQSFRHLIDNAIKFTPAQGTVRVTLIDEPNRIVLSVQDNGIGISANMQERIFQPFFRLDNSLTNQDAGLGIGLAIVKHAIEAHGGSVSIHSEVDVGSRFTVLLPREGVAPSKDV